MLQYFSEVRGLGDVRHANQAPLRVAGWRELDEAKRRGAGDRAGLVNREAVRLESKPLRWASTSHEGLGGVGRGRAREA